ncbi:MAG: putative signal peptidase [Frankiales bacterium]|nr:putative signal peptidase [Frankiales bacterium]MCW2586079.1 putative signal peptidase [Frankiales bacterium]
MRMGTVRVSGPSMVPTLYGGDLLVVRRGARVRTGDLVVGRLRARPELLVVKRAVAEQDGGWQVVSDNPYGGSVSGLADVEARVLLRYWPPRRRRG